MENLSLRFKCNYPSIRAHRSSKRHCKGTNVGPHIQNYVAGAQKSSHQCEFLFGPLTVRSKKSANHIVRIERKCSIAPSDKLWAIPQSN